MLPTIVNTIAVLIGAGIGLLFHSWLHERYRRILFQGIGLATLLIGLTEALKTQEMLLLAFSMILGGFLGEWINIEERLEAAGEWLKNHVGNPDDPEFIDGYVYASLLFCVGALAVVGSFRAGVQGDGTLLYTKSLLDGHAAIFLAGAMGAGVMASAVSVLVFQGFLTLVFMLWGGNLPEYVITEVGASGGLLIVGISINLLELGHIRLGNLLPAMLFAGLFAAIKPIIINGGNL